MAQDDSCLYGIREKMPGMSIPQKFHNVTAVTIAYDGSLMVICRMRDSHRGAIREGYGSRIQVYSGGHGLFLQMGGGDRSKRLCLHHNHRIHSGPYDIQIRGTGNVSRLIMANRLKVRGYTSCMTSIELNRITPHDTTHQPTG